MNKDKFMILILIVCSMLAGGLILGSAVNSDMQQQAIKHGAAQYNAQDGSFEWAK